MMNYESFRQYVKKLLEWEFPDKQVVVNKIQKPNDIMEWGITIQDAGHAIDPVIYLEPYYHAYEEGTMKIEGVARDIAQRYYTQLEKAVLPGQISLNFEKVKSKIIMEVLEIRRNQDVLSRRIYHPIGNGMAKAFRILAEQTEDVTTTVEVTRGIAEAFSYPPAEELARLADENTPRLLPVTWQILDENEKRLLGMGNMSDGQPGASELYVLSNDIHLRGAAALYYPGIQEQIREWIGGDYWVLPRSIHEVLILPATDNWHAEKLQEIVKTANESQVRETDRLSDYVMYYDADQKLLNMPLANVPVKPQIPIDTISLGLRDIVRETSALDEEAEALYVPRHGYPATIMRELPEEVERLGLSKYVDFTQEGFDMVVDKGIVNQFDMTRAKTKPLGKIPEKIPRF